MKFKTYLLLAFSLFLFSTLASAQQSNLSNQAFNILQEKCNTCHQIKKPKQIYTLENMAGFAKKINKQVFIKKRMPKGEEITLTKEEYEQLKDWLLSLDVD